MDVHKTVDSAEFASAAASFLSQDPVGNTVLLTVLEHERLSPTDGAWFTCVSDNGRVVGAALRTPPYNVALSMMDVDVATLLGSDDDSPGAVGSRDVVEAFAGDRRIDSFMLETQYTLTELVAPAAATGAARHYCADDADLYVRWIDDFAAEAGLRRDPEPLSGLDNRLRAGGALWFWEYDGQPVAMAGRSGPVGGVPRIGPVWTPPDRRRNGYAAALTAHVCAEAFAAGASACTLFADAANATANGIYVRLGFHPVREIIDARFGASTADVS